MELKTMIYQVWEELEGYNITDDTLFDYDYLKSKFIAMHPSLVKETWDARLPLNGFYQKVSCIEIVRIMDKYTIDGVDFESTDTSLKAILPPLVKTIGKSNIKYFGLNNFSKEIPIVSMEMFRFKEGSRFTADNACGVVVGDEIYFKDLPTTSMAGGTLVGILSDPTQACDWPDDDGCEFPTPSAMRMMIAIKKDIFSMVGRPDLVHDSQIALGGTQQKRPQTDEGGAQ